MLNPYPSRNGYLLDYVGHSGSLPNDGVTYSVVELDIMHFPFHGSLAYFKFLY